MVNRLVAAIVDIRYCIMNIKNRFKIKIIYMILSRVHLFLVSVTFYNE